MSEASGRTFLAFRENPLPTITEGPTRASPKSITNVIEEGLVGEFFTLLACHQEYSTQN